MPKKILLLALAVFVVLAFSGCNQDVVATVNGEKITGAELAQRVDAIKSSMEKQGIDFSGENGQAYMESLRESTLDGMISNKLVLQEAKKAGKLSPEQIQEIVTPFKNQFPTQEEYEDFLAQIMLSEEEVAYVLRLQEQVTKDVLPLSEADVKKYYDENIEMFEHPAQLQVRHILFFIDDGSKGFPVQHTDDEARQMAEAVIARLDQGEDFAALAREKSEDRGTSSDGGLYTFSEGEAVKEFSDAANALSPGAYTRTPVKTEYGYHVIKMEKRIAAGQYPFEEVKQRLTEQLNEMEMNNKFSSYMQEVKDKAEIVNKLGK